MLRLRRLGASDYHRLATLLGAALLVRLPFLLTPGYDVRDYRAWAWVVGEVGIGRAYSAAYPPGVPWLNYPPFYLYVLRVTGLAYATLRPDGDWDDQVLAAMLKLSPILAEIALGLFLYRFLRRYASAPVALGGTAAYLLNPAIIWNTSYWGGIDAFHTLFLTGALFAAAQRHPARAWPLAVLAVGAKPLALPGALATVPPALRTATLRGLTGAAGAAVVTGLLLAGPVILQGEAAAMVRAMARNLGNQAVLSANAHNLWWVVTWGNGWQADTRDLVPGLDYRTIGLGLFATVAAWALAGLWPRADDPVATCATGAYLSYAFFVLTTEVHENWSVALFAPLAAAAALRPCHRPLYLALALTTLANLALHDPPLRDLLGDGFDAVAHRLGLLNAAAGCILFGWWTLMLIRTERFPVLPWRSGTGAGRAAAAPAPRGPLR